MELRWIKMLVPSATEALVTDYVRGSLEKNGPNTHQQAHDALLRAGLAALAKPAPKKKKK